MVLFSISLPNPFQTHFSFLINPWIFWQQGQFSMCWGFLFVCFFHVALLLIRITINGEEVGMEGLTADCTPGMEFSCWPLGCFCPDTHPLPDPRAHHTSRCTTLPWQPTSPGTASRSSLGDDSKVTGKLCVLEVGSAVRRYWRCHLHGPCGLSQRCKHRAQTEGNSDLRPKQVVHMGLCTRKWQQRWNTPYWPQEFLPTMFSRELPQALPGCASSPADGVDTPPQDHAIDGPCFPLTPPTPLPPSLISFSSSRTPFPPAQRDLITGLPSHTLPQSDSLWPIKPHRPGFPFSTGASWSYQAGRVVHRARGAGNTAGDSMGMWGGTCRRWYHWVQRLCC